MTGMDAAVIRCGAVDPDGDGVCYLVQGHDGDHEQAFDKTWPLTKGWGWVTGVLRWTEPEPEDDE